VTLREREFISRLCAERAGLRVDPTKAYLVESRLGPVARREGFGSVSELVTALKERHDDTQVWAAVEAMTLPDTAFFREPGLLERLWSDVVPTLARRQGGEIRIWSAGCASGQEIYSLAMLMEEAAPLGVQVELFASDLSDRQLEKAQAGLYSQFEVQRGLSARRLVRHFEKRDDLFQLSRRVRQHVRWRRVNLIEDISRLGQFDMVLCRHVLGGLTHSARAQAADSLAAALRPGGVLVLDREVAGLVATPALQPMTGLGGVYTAVSVERAAA
jgi:chemotaxis protein methyltransferase CheR